MILLTGFEPFDGAPTNPSWGAVQAARDILSAEGLGVEAVELPCVFGESVQVLRREIERLRPALVVSAGVAGGRDRLSLERVAINCDDARIPDNAGNRPVDEEVVPGGPAAYFSTLPVKAALQALKIAGLRAEVSQSAGTYVCNHVFYGLMHHLATDSPGSRGGFIHVPREAQAGIPGMSLPDMAEGIAVVVRTAWGTAQDLKLAAGAIH
jgi:pyroglutamyl-peptidase